MPNVKSITLSRDFAVPVDRIWMVLADVARFQEAGGLPLSEVGGGVPTLGETQGGNAWRPDRTPPNWIYGRWFSHCREFRHGPFRCLRTTCTLRPDGDGSHVEYTIEMEPANLFGIVLGGRLLRRLRKKSLRLFADAEAYCEGLRDTEFDFPAIKRRAGVLERVRQIADRINAAENGHDLGHDLAHYVLTRPRIDAAVIRPLRLARLCDVPARLTIEACLQAVKEGLLVLGWHVVCTRCRQKIQAVGSLQLLPETARCPYCEIDCSVEASGNVELVFSPSPAIREVDNEAPQGLGPMSAPHILAQITVAAGEQHVESIRLRSPGKYRVRTSGAGGECRIEYPGGSFPELIAESDVVLTGAPVSVGMLAFINRSPNTLTFILEEEAWRDDLLTAARVGALQAFRDLFPGELTPVGRSFSVDGLSFMFTDLKDFTAVYERIGDLRAYALVSEHFDAVTDAVREYDGAVVRQSGDSAMAVFHHPADALRCAIRVQHDMCWYNRTTTEHAIQVKIGLHKGPCLAVNLDNRLEYFGSAVNLCARIQEHSHGGDIVLSDELARDETLASISNTHVMVHEQGALQGIADAVSIWRIGAERFVGESSGC